jgi:hypothetical protein
MRNGRRQPLDDPVVPTGNPADPLFANIAARRPVLRKRLCTDLPRVGRMKTLDELPRKRTVASKAASARPAGEKIVKGRVTSSRGKTAHHMVEPFPEVIERLQLSIRRHPPLTANIDRGHACVLQDATKLRRAAVDEFGTKLDRDRGAGVVPREDAAAEPLACLEDHHLDTRLVQRTRRGDAGCTGTDDDNVDFRR